VNADDDVCQNTTGTKFQQHGNDPAAPAIGQLCLGAYAEMLKQQRLPARILSAGG